MRIEFILEQLREARESAQLVRRVLRSDGTSRECPINGGSGLVG
jgi:hypothetical protein